MVASSPAAAEQELFVPETRFGVWFLGTGLWFHFVLTAAVRDLRALMDERKKSYPVVVDVGCGRGLSFRLLKMAFRPGRLIGIEMEPDVLEDARQRAKADKVTVELLQNDCAAIDLADASADIVFCHQTFHHLVQQEKALAEFYRILKPGGLLLFAESTRAYIHSWVIRWLFAHPMDVQRTADEYLAMIKKQGFEFEPRNVSLPYLWWSRPDFGVLEWAGMAREERGAREETLVNVVARKP